MISTIKTTYVTWTESGCFLVGTIVGEFLSEEIPTCIIKVGNKLYCRPRGSILPCLAI